MTLNLVIRNMVYWILLSVGCVVAFCAIFCLLPFSVKRRYQAGQICPLLAMWLLENVIGLRYEVENHNPEKCGAVIIASKHQSGWETFALQFIFMPTVFVAKKELLKIPFFGWGLALVGTISIDRKAGKQASSQLMTQGKKRLEEGFNIVIFPEGTRIPAGEIGHYKSGVSRLALNLGLPITPVAHNAGEYWPKNAFFKYPGVVRVVIGRPIETHQKTSEIITQELTQWIEAQQRRIEGAGPFFKPTAKK
ncbi:MAG: 1-acyl-sn-glycerol-3-phosphate acyltransferase [Neisseriaceae bacterium]|nr:1-acyl-sn-glycerol-3-phosphate acyltransferase [Neisseriaceae bacterium]